MDGCRYSRKKILFFISFVSALAPKFAFSDSINSEWYSSARALSMGNVGIASAEDTTTQMFYNPALLAKNKKATVELFNPHLEIGMGNFGLSAKTGDVWQQNKLGNVVPLHQAKGQKGSYFDGSLYPNFVGQNFSLGFLMRGQASSYLDANDKLVYRSRYLFMPTLGMSLGLLSGRVKFGFALRAIQITGNDASTSNYAFNGNIGYTSDAAQGFGIGLDAGLAFTLPWNTLPTFGIVARNIGDTSFPGSAPFYSVSQSAGNIPSYNKIKSTYDIGASISPKSGRNSYTLAADFRDATQQNSDIAMLRRVNAGMEVGFNKFFFVRLGARSGYWTAGIGVSGKKATLDLGSYADELDRTGFRVLEDRRVVLRYGGRF